MDIHETIFINKFASLAAVAAVIRSIGLFRSQLCGLSSGTSIC